MLLLPVVTLGLAADAPVNAGYGSTGSGAGHQRDRGRGACRPQPDQQDRRADAGTHGPLITEAQSDKVAGYIDIASADGADVVIYGRGIEVQGDISGFWLGAEH